MDLILPDTAGIRVCHARCVASFFVSKTRSANNATVWCLWCSGNTTLCGRVITGSIPVRHPSKRHLLIAGVFCYTSYMIYLIGGTPRSGKTTVAKVLANKLKISWVSCDSLEGIPKFYTPKNVYHKHFPKDIMRRATKNSNDLMYTRFSANQIVQAYITQGSSVWTAVEQFIEYLIGEDISYIIEGYQLPPKSVAKLKSKFPKKIKSIYLIKEHPDKILEGALAHTHKKDWFKTKTTNPEIYMKIAEMLSMYGSKIKKDATTLKLKVINTDTRFNERIKQAVQTLS